MNEIKVKPEDYGYKLCGEIVLNERCISKSNSKSRWLEKRFKEFEERIIQACRKFGVKKSNKEFGWVVLECHYKHKMHTDLNNCFKSVCDGLVKAGMFYDDKEICVTAVPAKLGKEDKTIIQIWR